MPSKQVFRQAALDKLAAPEELDKMIQVTSLKGWIALGGLVLVVVAAVVWGIFGSIPRELKTNGILVKENGIQEIATSDAGVITDLTVKPGDQVKTGQVLAKLTTAPDKITQIISPGTGTILDVLVEKNMEVKAQTTVADLELASAPLKGVLFVSLLDGKRVQPGMKVQLSPTNVRAEEYGYLLGTITYVSQLPVSPDKLFLEFKNKELVDIAVSGGPTFQVDVDLEKDAGTTSGFKWTSTSGPPLNISSGTLFSANVVLGKQRPISLVLPVLRDEEK